MVDSTLGKPTPKHISDYTFVNIISRDELNTCTRHVVDSRYKQNHSTHCSKLQGMSVVRQPSDTMHY